MITKYAGKKKETQQHWLGRDGEGREKEVERNKNKWETGRMARAIGYEIVNKAVAWVKESNE